MTTGEKIEEKEIKAKYLTNLTFSDPEFGDKFNQSAVAKIGIRVIEYFNNDNNLIRVPILTQLALREFLNLVAEQKTFSFTGDFEGKQVSGRLYLADERKLSCSGTQYTGLLGFDDLR